MRSRLAVDGVKGFTHAIGECVGGGDDVRVGLDLDGPVAAGGLDELADRPAGLALDPAADCQGGENDRKVTLD